MIEKLQWDSAFFGYPVGRIILPGPVSENTIRTIPGMEDFRLVYVFSDTGLPKEFDASLVARRLEYSKNLSGQKTHTTVSLYDKNTDSYQELINLALQCGGLSRFRVDKNFRNKEYERLYKKWIDKSLNEENIYVLVTRSTKHLTGFITIDCKDKKTGRLGLIAVDANYQNKGIGTDLMKMIEKVCLDNGKHSIHAVTHFGNHGAVTILKKREYKKVSSSFVYHLWNK